MSALDEKGQRLNEARAIMADIADYTDAEVLMACAVVGELSDDVEERDEAVALRDRLNGAFLT